MTIKKCFWHIITLVCLTHLSVQTQAAVCTYKIDKEWNKGFTAEISITNNTSRAIKGWSVSWKYQKNEITGWWRAKLSGNNPYTATHLGRNRFIEPGETVSFGMQGLKNGNSAEIPIIKGDVCRNSSSKQSSSVISNSSRSRSSVIFDHICYISPSSPLCQHYLRSSSSSSSSSSLASTAATSSYSSRGLSCPQGNSWPDCPPSTWSDEFCAKHSHICKR